MGFSDTQGYRLGILFIVFVLISLGFLSAQKHLDEYLRRHKLRALRHVTEHFREEFLLLGFISLLLAAFDSALKKICVSASKSEVEAAQASGKAYGYNTCPEGKAPFWDSKTLHQTHVFMFILACTHICYACVSMGLCVFKMRTWRRYEEEASRGDPLASLQPLAKRLTPPSPGAGAGGLTLLRLVCRCFVAQFRDSVNRDVYLDLRRLFIERTGAPVDFNFLDFIMESMEEDYARVLSTNYMMWLVAAIYVTIPQFVFLPASIITLVVMLFMGTVLESILLRLAQCSYELFQTQPPPPPLVVVVSPEGAAAGGGGGAAATPSIDSIDFGVAAAAAAGGRTPSGGVHGGEGGDADKKHTTGDGGDGASDTFHGHDHGHDHDHGHGGGDMDGDDLFDDYMDDGDLYDETEEEREHREQQERLAAARHVMATRLDAANFFWRGKPFLMFRVFQYVLFENSMSLSLLTFSLWQDPEYLTKNIAFGWGAVGIILVVDFCIMAHTSVFVLPVYAIAASVGSHSSLTVVEYARKKGISGERAMELHRKKSQMEDGTNGGGGGGGGGSRRGSQDGGSETSASGRERKAWAQNWDSQAQAVGWTKLKATKLSEVSEDHEAHNEKSVSALLGAILTKRLNDERQREKAGRLDQEVREARKERMEKKKKLSAVAAFVAAGVAATQRRRSSDLERWEEVDGGAKAQSGEEEQQLVMVRDTSPVHSSAAATAAAAAHGTGTGTGTPTRSLNGSARTSWSAQHASHAPVADTFSSASFAGQQQQGPLSRTSSVTSPLDVRHPLTSTGSMGTPSLMSIFFPNATRDGKSELERMTGGLDAALAEAGAAPARTSCDGGFAGGGSGSGRLLQRINSDTSRGSAKSHGSRAGPTTLQQESRRRIRSNSLFPGGSSSDDSNDDSDDDGDDDDDDERLSTSGGGGGGGGGSGSGRHGALGSRRAAPTRTRSPSPDIDSSARTRALLRGGSGGVGAGGSGDLSAADSQGCLLLQPESIAITVDEPSTVAVAGAGVGHHQGEGEGESEGEVRLSLD